MTYLDQPCTRCGKTAVIPPLKKDIGNQPLLVRCDYCKKFSRYNITHHADDTTAYWLSKWGRGSGDLVLVRRWLRRDQAGLSSQEIRRRLDRNNGHAV